MYSDDTTRLHHMLDAARNIERYAQRKTRQDLDSDELLAMGLAHWVQSIGEASRLLSQAVKDSHGEIPWKLIQGMRHRIVHDYDEVNLDILWLTVTKSIPELLPKLQEMLEEIEPDQSG